MSNANHPIPHSDRPLASVTVAGIVERDGSFLMVEERINGTLLINQPAGHVEPGETILEAVVREVLEETRYHFRPEALLGVYHANPPSGRRYLRIAIIGDVEGEPDGAAYDDGIEVARFMMPDEIHGRYAGRHRSDFVASNIADHQRGQRFPLDVLHTLLN